MSPIHYYEKMGNLPNIHLKYWLFKRFQVRICWICWGQRMGQIRFGWFLADPNSTRKQSCNTHGNFYQGYDGYEFELEILLTVFRNAAPPWNALRFFYQPQLVIVTPGFWTINGKCELRFGSTHSMCRQEIRKEMELQLLVGHRRIWGLAMEKRCTQPDDKGTS